MNTQLVREKQDLTYLSWSVYRNSSGTAGSFLKSYSELGGRKVYYKLSNFDKVQGVTGHECVNELIVDRLLMILGIAHLPYQLIHADIMVDGKLGMYTFVPRKISRKRVSPKLPWMHIRKEKDMRRNLLLIFVYERDGKIIFIRCLWWTI